MSGTCVSKVLFSLGGDGANGVFSVTPLLDPADPAQRGQPGDAALQGAGEEVPARSADATDGIVAYGWTTGALLREDPRVVAEARPASR